ncbi:MAG: MBL fold metallo-hydrolase [Elusimicrobia bacterium]|nr:MBL fold metallo-hydrolase [Elusimicrobiota bacterium]
MRTAAAVAAAALALAGCGEVSFIPAALPSAAPKAPVLGPELPVSPVFGASLIANRNVSGVTVAALVVGRGRIRGSEVSSLKSPEARLRPPVLAFLIRHPTKGAILFGTGLPDDLGRLGRRHERGSPLSPFRIEGGGLIPRLARLGVKPEDVKWIILPDLAPEWAGQAGAFPNATVVVSSGAWSNPRRDDMGAGLPDPRDYVPEERLRIVDFSGKDPYGPFRHGVDLFKDGSLVLLDLSGGATGGMGLWVNLDSGPLLLSGPAALVYDNVYDKALPDRGIVADLSGFAWNARAMRQALGAVPRLIVAPAYDLSPLRISPRPDIAIAP